MFIIKNNYYVYIENTKSINLDLLKNNKKFTIIYRNNTTKESYTALNKFRNKCRIKKFKFYVANNKSLATLCKADGLYISSYNKKIYPKNLKGIIGSAHNFREIYEKTKQGCKTIVLSRLFKTSYKNKKDYMGVIKFNLMKRNCLTNLVPLGGINNNNLLKLNLVNSHGLSLLSEIKKKPAISSRLF